MPTVSAGSNRKGRVSLSIAQDLLDRLEPFKQEVNLSAQTEAMLSALVDQLENRQWATRNAESLAALGRTIASTGLAGAEFERV